MTIGTLGIGRLVRNRFGLGILRQITTVMAGRALCQTRMIHTRWAPGHKVAVPVARVARPRYRNMPDRLGGRALRRIGATVTGCARYTSGC